MSGPRVPRARLAGPWPSWAGVFRPVPCVRNDARDSDRARGELAARAVDLRRGRLPDDLVAGRLRGACLRTGRSQGRDADRPDRELRDERGGPQRCEATRAPVHRERCRRPVAPEDREHTDVRVSELGDDDDRSDPPPELLARAEDQSIDRTLRDAELTRDLLVAEPGEAVQSDDVTLARGELGQRDLQRSQLGTDSDDPLRVPVRRFDIARERGSRALSHQPAAAVVARDRGEPRRGVLGTVSCEQTAVRGEERPLRRVLGVAPIAQQRVAEDEHHPSVLVEELACRVRRRVRLGPNDRLWNGHSDGSYGHYATADSAPCSTNDS